MASGRFQTLREDVSRYLTHRDFHMAHQLIREMMTALRSHRKGSEDRVVLSEMIDDAIQEFTKLAFLPLDKYTRCVREQDRTRILLGSDLIRLQFPSEKCQLESPYNQTPKHTLVYAMRALINLSEKDLDHQHPSYSSLNDAGQTSLDAAFRILQRLITGMGVRDLERSTLVSRTTPSPVSEKDFNRVLNAFANTGRMDMAHRIVALQERMNSPLSPVTYSILLKGYGRLRDLSHVELVLHNAKQHGVIPDTIFLNSIIDAYINCDALDKAQSVFDSMLDRRSLDRTESSPSHLLWNNSRLPPPNIRTYNTILKGLAKMGKIDDALYLTDEMKSRRLWDPVTTNTLVRAAIRAKRFALAEDILSKETTLIRTEKQHHHHHQQQQQQQQHPNVEAYTELLDGYARHGELDKAVSVMQTMKQHSVAPNEVTFTCLIAGMARNGKLNQAKDTLKYMKSTGLVPSKITYNALIAALVEPSEKYDGGGGSTLTISHDYDDKVNEALAIFREMMKAGVRPNAVTLVTLVEALGRCTTPRLSVISLLIDKMEKDSLLASGNTMVMTAAIRACGVAGDLKAALAFFRKIAQPDVQAVNTLLDTCCKCKNDSVLLQIFDYNFRTRTGSSRTSNSLAPDVVSYTILISGLLRTHLNISHAKKFYEEMRNRDILPDKALIDVILRAMLRHGQVQKLSKKEAMFVATVLRDAEKLSWDVGQLERRKRVSFSVLSDVARDVWTKNEEMQEIVRNSPSDDLFQRKGWNKVDSGFSLWGHGRAMKAFESPVPSTSKPVDSFLRAHGWNDVDSGFRII